MSGDEVFVRTSDTFGLGAGQVVDTFSGATPLGQVATHPGGELVLQNAVGEPLSTLDYFLGLIPGSIGETSVLAILIGAVILLWTGIASWRVILSVFVGGLVMGGIAYLFHRPFIPARRFLPSTSYVSADLLLQPSLWRPIP